MERMLVGRDRLVADLRAFVRAGTSLVVTGDPGIGKTAVVDETLRGLGDASVLRVAGAPSGSLLLGPFLALVDRPAASAPTEVTTLAAAVLHDIRRRDPVVVAVDDAHRLDAASVEVVSALAAAGTAVLAVTPALDLAPAGIRDLTRIDGAGHVQVPPLDEHEVVELVQRMLQGPVDPGLSRAIATRAAGNPLIAEELVRYLTTEAWIVRESGVWRGPDRLPTVPALATMVDAGLLAAPAAVREAVETVALGEGLTVEVATTLIAPDVLETAEARGWLRLDAEGDASVLRVRHGLLREAVVAAVPHLRRRRLLAGIADALPAGDGPFGVTGLRRARLRLDAGAPVDLAALLALAEATQVTDPALSRQATDRATTVAVSPTDLLRLVHLHLHQHRLDASTAALRRLEAIALPDADQLEAALAQTFLLLLVVGAPDEALDRLAALERRHGSRDVISAQRAMGLWLTGRSADAARTAAEVLDDAASSSAARVQAAQTLGSAALQTGDAAAFRRADRVMAELHHDPTTGLPEAAEARALLGILHLSDVAADPREAIRRATPRHRAALDRGDEGTRAQYATEIAWAMLLGGRAGEAVAMLRPAIAAQGMWTALTRPWVASRLLIAAHAAGVPIDDAALLDLVTADYFPEAVIARAAVASDPVAELVAGERRLVVSGGMHAAAMLRYAAVRHGDLAAADRFVRAPGSFRPEAVAAMTAHARALRAGGAAALEGASYALDQAGLTWFAVSAQRQAVARLLSEGATERVRIATARLRRLGAGCPGEALIDTEVADVLTDRELEVAELVAAGLTDREVATRLGVSVRTVGAHLGRVYRKTSVSGRHDLGVLAHLARPTT